MNDKQPEIVTGIVVEYPRNRTYTIGVDFPTLEKACRSLALDRLRRIYQSASLTITPHHLILGYYETITGCGEIVYESCDGTITIIIP